jgi:tetratricopeptide (TPR) repeat protein
MTPKFAKGIGAMLLSTLLVASAASAQSQWLQQANNLERTGQWQLVVELDTKAIAAGEGAPAYNNRSHAYNELKQYQHAIEDANEAIGLDLKFALAYSNRGRAYAGLGQYPRALQDLDKSIALDQNLFNGYINRGLCYNSMHQFPRALEDFNKAVELEPNSPFALSDRGIVYAQQRELPLAIKDFDKAIAIDPTYLAAYGNRGAAYNDMKDFEHALDSLNKAIELDPTFATAYNNRGIAYKGLKQYQLAIQDFQKYISIDPSNALTYLNRGNCYAAMKEYQRAVADYNEAIKLDPNFMPAYGSRAYSLTCLKQYAAAIDDANRAIAANPSGSDVCCTKGWALLMSGRVDDALDVFNSAMQKGVQGTWWFTGIGTVYEIKGNEQLASQNYRMAKACPDFKIDGQRADEWKHIVLSSVGKTTPGVTAHNPASAALTKLPGDKALTLPPEPRSNSLDGPIRDKWALVIGISHFQHPEYNLPNSAKDAKDFYNYLVSVAHFSPDHIRMLIDKDATSLNIKSSFGDDWLPKLAEPGDLVVVYISTHGTPASKDRGGKNYIVAYDTNRDHLYSTGVPMDELTDRIKNAVKSDRVLIVMDTCYSGGAAASARGGETPDTFDANKLAQDMGKGRLIISSCSPQQRSWESKNYQNGVFTRFFLNALKQNHGNIDVRKALDSIKEPVEWEVKRDWDAEQVPQIAGDWQGSDLDIAAKATMPRPMGPNSASNK